MFAVRSKEKTQTASRVSRFPSFAVQFNVNELQAGQGSGLGLYISLGIVQQHGGTLEVSSEGIGHGTTFTLKLPLCYVPDLDSGNDLKVEGASEIMLAEEDNTQLFPLRILVVDDVAINRRMLTRLVEKRGHIVTEAENGEIAVNRVIDAATRGEVFDTILMDYEMPVLNGPDAARKIRGLGSSAYIIGITGNVLVEDKNYFKAHGADDVLPKPVQFKELEQMWVRNGVFGRHKSGDEAV